MRWWGWAAVGVVAASLLLGGCSSLSAEEQREAEREQRLAGTFGVIGGAALSTALAVRAGRREASHASPALGIVARVVGSAACMLTGTFTAAFASLFIWPRELLSQQPKSSPDPSSIMLTLIFAGPFLVLFALLALTLVPIGARRLHRFGHVPLQEAIVALATLGVGALPLVG